MPTKIWEYEKAFTDAFYDAIDKIMEAAKKGKAMTLKEVIEMGFNNVKCLGKYGFDESSFTSKELNTKVDFEEWSSDADGYRYVVLKEVR